MADKVDMKQEINALEEEHNRLVETRIARAKEYNALIGEEYDHSAAILEAQKDLIAQYEQRLQLMTMAKEDRMELVDALEREADILEAQVESGLKTAAAAQERLEEIQKIQESHLQISMMSEEELATEKEITSAQIKRMKNLQKIEALTKDLAKQIAGTLNSMLGIRDASNDILTKMGKLKGLGGSWAKTIAAAAKEFFSAENRVNMFASAADKMKEKAFALGAMMLKMVSSLDKSQVGFRTATGAGKEWDDRILSQWKNTKHLNNSLEDTVKANQSLYEGLSGFANMSAKAGDELANFTSGMERVGVSTDATAELLQNMQTSFGYTIEQAQDAEVMFYGLGKAIGVSTKKMIADWNANAGALTKFGKKAKDIFMKTAATARGLGMEVSTLLKITEGFDTFEGAADKVGQLNAMLGGPYLNSLEMLETTDPTERVRMLARAVEQGGQSWATMGYYGKKAIAEAAGMSVEEASKVFGAGAAGIDAWSAKQAEAAKEAEKLAAEQKANSDMGRQWMRILNDLSAALMPLVDTFRGFVQTISNLGLTSKPVMYTLIGIWGAMKLLQFWAAMAAAKTTVLNLVTGTSPAVDVPAAAGKGFLAKATAFLGAASGAAVAPILAVAAAILAGGVAVAIIVLSLAVLASSMQGLGANGITLIAVMVLLGVAFWAGAPAITAFGIAAGVAATPIGLVAGPLFLIALGAALVGLAFAAIGYAIAAIIDSIVGLIALLIENHEVVLKVAGALSIMALAAIGLALAGFFAALALVAMAGGVFLLGLALKIISTEDLQAMGNIFLGIGNITYATVGAVYMMVDAIKEMAEAADDIEFNDSKFEAIRKTVDAMASTKGLNAKVLAATTHTIRAMSDLTRSSAEARVEPMQMAVNLIKEIKGGEGATSGAGAGSTSAAGGGQTIVIELNERELGRAVNAVLSNKYNLAKLT